MTMTLPAETFTPSAPSPRLLLLSDCSASDTVAGELQLFRLLGRFPAGEVTIIEGDMLPSKPQTRLPGVEYLTINYLPPYYRTRLNRYWNTWLLWSIRRHADRLSRMARERQVNSVLTVAHGYLWIAAAEVAKRLDVPLHLIVHDDWPTCANVMKVAKSWRHRLFGEVYRQAASRLCVSPFMEEEYRRRYGCEGDVLLPCRGPDVPSPSIRVREHDGPFVMAYAGSIHTTGYVELIRLAAAEVARQGGEFHLYTNADAAGLKAAGLDGPEIKNCGFLSSNEFIERLAANSDALFLPMSFQEELEVPMRFCFPSKLTDYTAAGLPIVIWGPEYCSAIRWAEMNPRVAMCVTERDLETFGARLQEVIQNAGVRRELAEHAVKVGHISFEYEQTIAKFDDIFN